MGNSENYTLTIGTNGGGVPVRDLYRFLEHLRGAYVRSLWALPQISPAVSLGDERSLRTLAAEALAKGPPLRGYVVDSVAASDLPDDKDLLLIDIRRENPLELLLAGTGAALAIAIIISGGEIKIGPTGIHFKVNSLGDGIKKIRAAFSTRSVTAKPAKKLLPPLQDDV